LRASGRRIGDEIIVPVARLERVRAGRDGTGGSPEGGGAAAAMHGADDTGLLLVRATRRASRAVHIDVEFVPSRRL